jgi:multiple sugar transport system substrate-binding protein
MTFIVSAVIGFSLLAGCAQSADSTAKVQEEPEVKAKAEAPQAPVTLKVLRYRAGLDENAFQSLVAEPVKKKYPNISMEFIVEQDWNNIEAMVAAHQFPDLIMSGIMNVFSYTELGMVSDLNPMIKKQQFNVNAILPVSIELSKKYGEHGELYGMPIFMDFPVLYYNKDIFDKFAVSYPKDGMSWEETIELAKRVTRSDGGIQYKGFSSVDFGRLSLSMLLRKEVVNSKVQFNTDSWKRALGIYRDLMTIPGNDIKKPWPEFSKDRIVAMNASFGHYTELEQMLKEGNPLNWDFTTFPTYKEKKFVIDTPQTVMLISKQSAHQDESFKVLEIITGKEAQVKMSKAAYATVLKDSDIQKEFGKDYETLKGKNIAALIKYQQLPLNYDSKYGVLLTKDINDAANKVIQGKLDVNTALRNAEEVGNKDIATMDGN